MSRWRSREWLTVFGGFFLLNLTYAATQPILVFNAGRGEDAGKYFTMAEQALHGDSVAAIQPFVRRPGTPLLAALTSKAAGWELEAAFKRVNIGANLLTVVLLTLLLQRHVADGLSRVLVLLFFMAEPHSPVRLVYAYPVYVDPIALTWLVGGLLVMDRVPLLTLIVGVGAAFRETTIVIGVALLFNRENLRRLTAWLPLIAGTTSLVIVGLAVVTMPSGYATSTEAWRFLSAKPPLNYVLAWLLVFGPMLVLPVFFWRRSVALLVEYPAYAAYLGAFALLAWVGGTDTERLLVFASPVVYILIANALTWSRLTPLAMAGLVAVQAASARAFGSIRGPGELLTPIEKAAAYQNLWTEFCPPRLLLLYWISYGLLAAALVAWLAVRRTPTRLNA